MRVQTANSTAYLNGCPYFWYTILYSYISLCTTFLWLLRFGWLLVFSLYKEDYLQFFKFVSVWLHGCCGKWEGWALVNRFNHTSGVTAATPTDRPKSVRNRSVIEVFGGVIMLSRCFLDFSFGVGVLVIGLSQIPSLFSCNLYQRQYLVWPGLIIWNVHEWHCIQYMCYYNII